MQEKAISTIIFKIKPQFSKKISLGHPGTVSLRIQSPGSRGSFDSALPPSGSVGEVLSTNLGH